MSAVATISEILSEASWSSDDSVTVDDSDEKGNENIELDQEIQSFVSLLDNQVFTDIHTMLNHCKEKYGFNFLEIQRRLNLDFYGSVRLVNFIRSETQKGRITSSLLSNADFEDDMYLKPVLEDDTVLYNLDEICETLNDSFKSNFNLQENVDSKESISLSRVSELEEELQRIRAQFDNYRKSVSEILDERWHAEPLSKVTTDIPKKSDIQDEEGYYFGSYAHNEIHEIMLKDTVRTDAYRDFIYSNKKSFSEKIALDVGCGTGILSMFCAKAGAKRVIAVENSKIIEKARENVFNNRLDDKIVCLSGKVEEVTLPVQSVDIIISEWMGYCLLYEAMLDSVIWARNKYLKPSGLMIPSHMNMWIAPFSDPDYIADHILFWRDVYSFDMKAMQAGIHEEVVVLDISPETICGEPFPFLQLDLYTVNVKDLKFTTSWHSKLLKNVDTLDGFVIWFDSFFMPNRNDSVPKNSKAENWPKNEDKGVAFTTGPNGKPSHWKQSVLMIDNINYSPVSGKADQEIRAELEFTTPEENPRALTISMRWRLDGESERSQKWQIR